MKWLTKLNLTRLTIKKQKKQYHFNKIIDEVTRYQKPSSGSFLET